MAKGQRSKFTKERAEAIARKLSAEVDLAGKHIKAKVYKDGELFLTFGFSHSKKKPNGHLPRNLFLSQSDTLALADCGISSEEYFKILEDKGHA